MNLIKNVQSHFDRKKFFNSSDWHGFSCFWHWIRMCIWIRVGMMGFGSQKLPFWIQFVSGVWLWYSIPYLKSLDDYFLHFVHCHWIGIFHVEIVKNWINISVSTRSKISVTMGCMSIKRLCRRVWWISCRLCRDSSNEMKNVRCTCILSLCISYFPNVIIHQNHLENPSP